MEVKELEILELPSNEVLKQSLESAVYACMKKDPYIAALLQEMNIRYDERIPSAAIWFDKKDEQFIIGLNPWSFSSLALKHRAAIMLHEVMHFSRGHLFRGELTTANPMQKLWNIAADMAINQYIPDIPSGCSKCSSIPLAELNDPCDNKCCPGRSVLVKDFKLKDGTPFPVLKTMEEYFDLLKETLEDHQKKKQEEKKEDGGTEGGKAIERYFKAKTTDAHGHDEEELSESDKDKMLKAAKKIIVRTIEKTSFEAGRGLDALKDLLKELEVMHNALNYKYILKMAIRKTVNASYKDLTWARPNRRYGQYAQGRKMADAPFIHFYADTSGSISYKEINLMLGIIEEFCNVGANKCMLGLWSDNLYYMKRHKKNGQLKKDDIVAGGTQIDSTLDRIKQDAPDLAIILTDGYYFADASVKLPSNIVWVITEGGQVNHPLAHIGKTIKATFLK